MLVSAVIVKDELEGGSVVFEIKLKDETIPHKPLVFKKTLAEYMSAGFHIGVILKIEIEHDSGANELVRAELVE